MSACSLIVTMLSFLFMIENGGRGEFTSLVSLPVKEILIIMIPFCLSIHNLHSRMSIILVIIKVTP